jgi:hypothetical protein
VSFAHRFSRSAGDEGTIRWAIGLDVHRDFCEVRDLGGGPTPFRRADRDRPEAVELFAHSLGWDDRVALEMTGNAWEIARVLEPHRR